MYEHDSEGLKRPTPPRPTCTALRASTGGVDWRNPYELLAAWSQHVAPESPNAS